MTCKRAPKAAFVGSVVSLLITIFAILIALVAPAQLRGGGQPSAKPTGAPMTQDASPALFLPVVAYDSGGNFAVSVAVADVNGDGKPDVLLANIFCPSTNNSGCIGVLLGNGDGTFQSTIAYDSGGFDAMSVAVTDINGDGKPDILVANWLSDTVGVLLGNGDGTFKPAVTYGSGGSNPQSVAVADVNGDGKPDLVVANLFSGGEGHGSVGVLLGNGDGTFQSAISYGSGGGADLFAGSVAVSDVNGDGKPDLLVTNECADSSCDGSVGVLLGQGDGTFKPAVAYSSGGHYASSVAVGDVNGDGKPDLLVTNIGESTVCVLLGNGDGTFKPAVAYGLGVSEPLSLAVADVNGDGNQDLVVAILGGAGNGHGLVGVLLGNGDGTFQSAISYDSGGLDAISVAVSDVNGDGKPDLLVANTNSGGQGDGSVGVLLNNTADTTPPVITLSVTPRVLWPPNGKMVPVTVSGTITDTGSGVNVSSAAYSVTDEYGVVHPAGTISLGAGGSYSFTVLLQASRLGTDLDGRHYTITVRASDNAGNSGSQASAVTVPHDQGD